jgi:hypothetical protein
MKIPREINGLDFISEEIALIEYTTSKITSGNRKKVYQAFLYGVTNTPTNKT